MDKSQDAINWLLDLWGTLTKRGESTVDLNSTDPHTTQQKLVPRSSIFNELSLEDGETTSGKHFIPVRHDNIPYPRNETIDFDSELFGQIDHVTRELESLSKMGDSSLQEIISIFTRYLEGVAISINGKDSSSIPFPLYARLQTSLRLASENGKVQLVYGDLSGIQKYIFDVSKLGVTGVAKKLRARSLRIALLTRLFADYLCKSSGGSHLQICISAGGVFYLLLSPSADVLKLTEEVNRWLVKEYHCAISFHVGAKVSSIQEIENEFSQIAEEVINNARICKERAFQQTLIRDGKWEQEHFVLRDEPLGDRCVHCQRHPIHRNGLCMMCDMDEQLGSLLPRTKFLRFRNDGNGDIVFADKLSVDLLRSYPSEVLSTEYALYGLEAASNTFSKVPMMWMNTHVPIAKEDCLHCLAVNSEVRVKKGDVYTFGCISSLGGTSYESLGYLKADVDSMGLLFALGFTGEKKDSASLYEYATLSHTLDRFFTFRLQQLLQQEYPHIYSVFSGGDDLYLIGQASDILLFSLRLKDEFSKYVLHPEVTISTGIAFVKPRKPLSRVTLEVEKLLEKAKESPSWSRYRAGVGGRNQITFHGQSFTWDEFSHLISEAQTIVDWMNKDLLSSGLIYRLNTVLSELSSNEEGFINPEDSNIWRLLPKISYELNRNLKEEKYKPIVRWIKRNCFISNDWSDDDWLILQSWPAFLFMIRLLKGDKNK